MSSFTPYTHHGSHRLSSETAESLLNAIRDTSWRIRTPEQRCIVAPVPLRARASYAPILDDQWELWHGEVRLISTKRKTIQRECLVSIDSMNCLLLCTHRGMVEFRVNITHTGLGHHLVRYSWTPM